MYSSSNLLFKGKNIYWGDGKSSEGSFLVKNGKIASVSEDGDEDFNVDLSDVKVIDAGSKLMMPGVIDSHVHVNEPGRTEWEGYKTATMAAASGGVTTIVDMPLNCIPPTTTMENLRTKVKAAQGKCHIDVCLWGGIVPDNVNELEEMVEEGVVGFKGFMCESGVDEFKMVNEQQIQTAMERLVNSDTVLLFHAEKNCTVNPKEHSDKMKYETFLETRPAEMEVEAIETIIKLCRKYRVRCHIVHLSTANALPVIEAAKMEGLPLTVETCHHYLNICSEDVPEGATHFKCCPPIRNKQNQTKLWEGLNRGTIDMVVSDHSPCTPDLKDPNVYDFITAWGGISSLQFGLQLMWTALKERGAGDVHKLLNLLTENTAKLCGLSKRKGKLAIGMDADVIIWDPEVKTQVTEAMILYKNKMSPYIGKALYGKVTQTYVRGHLVYEQGQFPSRPIGEVLLKKTRTFAE